MEVVQGMAQVKKGLAVAFALIVTFEGLRQWAYIDPVGIPTICYGETHDVHIGDYKTVEQCEGLAKAELTALIAAIDAEVKLPPEILGATASFCYNVGLSKCKSSTMFKHLKAGEYRAACNELPKWKYAKGKVLPGLVKRREAERALCLKGI